MKLTLINLSQKKDLQEGYWLTHKMEERAKLSILGNSWLRASAQGKQATPALGHQVSPLKSASQEEEPDWLGWNHMPSPDFFLFPEGGGGVVQGSLIGSSTRVT